MSAAITIVIAALTIVVDVLDNASRHRVRFKKRGGAPSGPFVNP